MMNETTFETEFGSESEMYKMIPKKLSELENDINAVSDENYVHTDNNFTDELQNQVIETHGATNELQKQLLEAHTTMGEMQKTLEVMGKVLVKDHPFEVIFANAKSYIANISSKAYYLTCDTYGDNWKVSEETSPELLEVNANNETKLRMFNTQACGTYFRAMTSRKNYVFEFTSPVPGVYGISVNLIIVSSGGYVDIYLNDELIGSEIDTYAETEQELKLHLNNHKLNAGKYANKIKIVPTGASTGTKSMVSIKGFSFEAPTD